MYSAMKYLIHFDKEQFNKELDNIFSYRQGSWTYVTSVHCPI